MLMRLFLWVVLLAVSLSGRAEFPVKAAFLVGPERYHSELGALTEQWEIELFQNRQLAELSARLSEFQLIGFGTLANYYDPVSLAPYATAWQAYLEAGGVLVIWDGNYDNSTNDLLTGFGETFRLGRGLCRLKEYINQAPPVSFAAAGTLFDLPYSLREMLGRRLGTWGHFETFDGYEPWMRCDEDCAIIVHRRIGKGHLFVTTLADFSASDSRKDLQHLLQNILLYCQQQSTGLEVAAVSATRNTEVLQLSGRLVNRTDEPAELTGRIALLLGKRVLASESFQQHCSAGESADFQASFPLPAPGGYRLALQLAVPGELSAAVPVTVPEPLTLSTHCRLIQPAIQAQVPFGCTVENPAAELNLTVDGQTTVDFRRRSPSLIEVDLSGVPAGEHRLTAIAGDDRAECRFEVLARNPRCHVDGRSNFVRDGQPRFLLGMYHVSWEQSAENRLECLHFAARNHFNFLHVSCKKGEDLRPFLTAAAEQGIMVTTEGVGREQIAAWREAPAVMAWNVMDEPEIYDLKPADLRNDYLHWRQVDPEHAVYTVLMRRESIRYFIDCADLIGHDPYPVPQAPIAEVYYNLAELADEAGRYRRCPVGVLQAFGGDQNDARFRAPTPDEFRNMTYQALAAGVKGIIFYTYIDGDFKLTEHPELLEAVRQAPSEIKELEPFLLNGEYRRLKTGDPDIFASEWRLGGRRLTITVNSGRQPAGGLEPLAVDVKITSMESGG
ncbi:hypothetical protein [Victivallis sp. Marseille-Q1083]|uniref:hypothetical protein n=1 Tax=Victivallis sp. Marseille-Q1083 TaxID=2717288 RepID=UPI00158C5B41|nr:hypothetical protein [Victivallis sp. Marseille-Q1083]